MLDVTETVPALDQEFFSDLAYDYYGNRIATCNSDHTITIWSKSGDKRSWKPTSTIQGRTGVFHRVAWAQPEFGQILAACSSDCNVVIYEETGDSESGEGTWAERARLVDSHGEVHALQFAPRHLGMQLATLGEDGIVRIYEAVDMMQLSAWPLRDEFSMILKPASTTSPSHSSISCLAWNTSPFDPPQLIVGRLDAIQIWQYSTSHRKWQHISDLLPNRGYVCDVAWAPNLARSYDLIATSFMGHDTVLSQIKAPGNVVQTWTLPVRGCRLSWNPAGTLLASSSPDGNVQVWGRDLEGDWKCIESLLPS